MLRYAYVCKNCSCVFTARYKTIRKCRECGGIVEIIHTEEWRPFIAYFYDPIDDADEENDLCYGDDPHDCS